MTKPILIIGKPNSGKTTFIAQLYARLQAQIGSLTLYKPVDNIAPINDALNLLANGEETKTTPTDRNVGLLLPIKYQNEKIDLFCPDYGGEQINRIIDVRDFEPKWVESIKESNNWIVFIRRSNLTGEFDLSNKTIAPDILKNGKGSSEEYLITDQTSLIELFQMMLHVKEHDYHFKNEKSKLTIVLTCWDETNNKGTPLEELRSALPLLLNFVEANWKKNCIKVLGLSAQGFSLNEAENREKYQNEGLENFGFLVAEDGKETSDITQLISESL